MTSDTRLTSARSACSGLSAVPRSSTIVAVSPSASNTNPRSEPDVRTRSPIVFNRVSRSSPAAMPAVVAYGLTPSTVAPIFGQHVRHHERGRAERVVEHDLEPAPLQPWMHRRCARGRTCSTPWREAGSRCRRCRPRTRGGSPRGRDRRSILRCVPSSMSAPFSSRNRISTLSGSLGARRTVIPPCARSLRTWNRVDGTVASSRSMTCTPLRLRPGHDRPLQRACRPTGVAATCTTDGTLLERGAVGHRQAHRDLRR